MEYVTVQNTSVPALGFGTWRLAGEDCRQAVEHALELGYRHLDTAQGYDNEAEVGQALKRAGVPRQEVFVTTKLRPSNFERARALRSTRESLKRLGSDYVDLLLMHWPNPEVPLEETLAAMLELQEEGAVRHIGLSNFPPSLVRRAGQTAAIFCNQVEYHPFLSQPLLLEQARRLDYLLTAYSPLARGRVLAEPVLVEIGRAHGKSAAQVTLRWLIQQDHVAAIPKAASAKHRAGNLDIFDFQLTDEEMARIDGLNREERLTDPADGPPWERP